MIYYTRKLQSEDIEAFAVLVKNGFTVEIETEDDSTLAVSIYRAAIKSPNINVTWGGGGSTYNVMNKNSSKPQLDDI